MKLIPTLTFIVSPFLALNLQASAPAQFSDETSAQAADDIFSSDLFGSDLSDDFSTDAKKKKKPKKKKYKSGGS